MLTTFIRILDCLNLLFMGEVSDDFASDSQFLVVLHFGVSLNFFNVFLFLLQKFYVVVADGDLVQVEVESFLLDLLVIDGVDILGHGGLVWVADLDGLDLLLLRRLELLLHALLARRARLEQLRVDGRVLLELLLGLLLLNFAVDLAQLLAEARGGPVQVIVVVGAIVVVVVVDVLQLFVGVDVGLQVARDGLADDLVVVLVLVVLEVRVVEHLAALLVDHAAVHDVLVEVIPVQSQVLRIVQVVHVIVVIKVNVVIRKVAGVVLLRPRELVVGLGLVQVRHHELLPLLAFLGQDLLLLEAFKLLLLDDVVIVRLHVFVSVRLLAQHRAEHHTIFKHSSRRSPTNIVHELLAAI